MNRKKLFGMIGVAAFAVSIMFNGNINVNNNNLLTDITLNNVEALANDEGSYVACEEQTQHYCKLDGILFLDFTPLPKPN